MGRYDPVVDEDSFWVFIAECREHSANDTELMSRLMFRRLRALSAEDVAAFARHWERARSSLYSWPVADAACLMLLTFIRLVRTWFRLLDGGRGYRGGRTAVGRVAAVHSVRLQVGRVRHDVVPL